MQVRVDNLDQALQYLYKNAEKPELWLLSRDTYFSIMSRSDALQYLEFFPKGQPDTFLGIPYLIKDA